MKQVSDYWLAYGARRLTVLFTEEQMDAINRQAEERDLRRSAIIKEAVQKQLVESS